MIKDCKESSNLTLRISYDQEGKINLDCVDSEYRRGLRQNEDEEKEQKNNLMVCATRGVGALLTVCAGSDLLG